MSENQMKRKSKWIIAIIIVIALIGIGLFFIFNKEKTFSKLDQGENVQYENLVSIKDYEEDSSYLNEEDPIFDDPIFEVDIKSAIDSLMEITQCWSSKGEDFVETYLKELYYINDSTALRLEIVKKSVWDSLKVVPSLNVVFEDVFAGKSVGVVRADSVILLKARNGKVVEFKNYYKPAKYVEVGETRKQNFLKGYSKDLDMWRVEYLDNIGHAVDHGYFYIDCQTGEVYISYENVIYSSKDDKVIFANYQNWPDMGSCWQIDTIKKGGYSIKLPLDFNRLKTVVEGWVNDSTVKLRLENYEITEQKYFDALSFRILHLNKTAAPKKEKYWE